MELKTLKCLTALAAVTANLYLHESHSSDTVESGNSFGAFQLWSLWVVAEMNGFIHAVCGEGNMGNGSTSLFQIVDNRVWGVLRSTVRCTFPIWALLNSLIWEIWCQLDRRCLYTDAVTEGNVFWSLVPFYLSASGCGKGVLHTAAELSWDVFSPPDPSVWVWSLSLFCWANMLAAFLFLLCIAPCWSGQVYGLCRLLLQGKFLWNTLLPVNMRTASRL